MVCNVYVVCAGGQGMGNEAYTICQRGLRHFEQCIAGLRIGLVYGVV